MSILLKLASTRLPVPTVLSILVLFSLIISACATAEADGSEGSDTESVDALAADSATGPQEFLVPDANSAVIVFWRPDNIGIGKAILLYRDLDLTNIIKENSIQQIRVSAGPLVLLAKARTWEYIKGEVMPGMTYHVLVNVTQRAKRVFARLELIQLDDPRISGLSNLKPVADPYPAKTRQSYQNRNARDAKAIMGKILSTTNEKKTFLATDGTS